jgi:hypothetical protein
MGDVPFAVVEKRVNSPSYAPTIAMKAESSGGFSVIDATKPLA